MKFCASFNATGGGEIGEDKESVICILEDALVAM